MASSTGLRANVSPLKRSFDCVSLSTDQKSFLEGNCAPRQYAERRSLSISSTTLNCQPRRFPKRRTLSTPSACSMLAQDTTVIMSTSFPSFMAVYGNEDNNVYDHAAAEHDTKREQLSFPQFRLSTSQNISETRSRLGERRGSLTSMTSYSTNSSPTTTSSTFDSPLVADQSPGSSPESASSAMPPKSFQQPRMRSTGTQTLDLSDERNVIPADPSTIRSMEDPRKNVRNLKLDMKLPGIARPLTAPSLDSPQPFSVPTSPLREPLRSSRKKPTNLTIRTPGFNQLAFGRSPAFPPTPAHKVMLHQAQSSPLLPSLASPTAGPVGGMRLALPNIAQHLNNDSSSGDLTPASGTNLPSLREEEAYQPPQSQEAPERGYTDGPCLIYDSGVYLYLEPTGEEASKFDTVINVAKEIRNPFESSPSDKNTIVSVWRTAGNRQSLAEPQTAMSEFSYKSALEWPTDSDPTTPTTPRPASVSQPKKPEYLHVRWDHNSEILEDLLPLCRLIDDRIQDGKKVLIHCQLGVSRSASLIIAYGLYKGYEPDFHSMYMTVKKRSQWVGPNMSLIYQLTDFKSKCDKGEYQHVVSPPKPEWLVHTLENAFTASTTASYLPENTTQSDQAKRMSENQKALRLNKELPPVPLFDQNTRTKVPPINSSMAERLHGFPPILPRQNSQEKTVKRAASRPLPFRERERMNQPAVIPPHRPRIIPGLTFAQPSMDLAMQDVPAVPSLFSPRATEFMAVPFGITTAGDLVTSTPKSVKPPPGAFPGGREWRNSLLMGSDTHGANSQVPSTGQFPYDPRSPAQQSDAKEILRSIDDVL